MIRQNRLSGPASVRRAAVETLEDRKLFAAAPYVLPAAPGVEVKVLLTVNDGSVPETGNPAGQYRMVGIPDGLGAYDNGNGTFTVLMNHELGSTAGVVRDHGSKGAFVSKYIVNKATKTVISGDDLIKSVRLWNPATQTFISGTTAFNRLCSADLPTEGAFFNPDTGKGTQSRIFMNGEETLEGRAFAHVVDSDDTSVADGTSFELPWLGKFAWENSVASPFPQDKTIVAGLDDSDRKFTTEGAGFPVAGGPANEPPSEVYFGIGNKQSTGTILERAGLANSILYGMKVGVTGNFDANEGSVASGERFSLVSLGDVSGKTAEQLHNDSVAAGITQFRRVEDGAWDPNSPRDHYFVTTDIFGGTTRLWRLRFDDIRNPEAGGTISIVEDSPPAKFGEMFDNMAVDQRDHVLITEDVGGNDYLGQILQKDLNTGDLTAVARHNPDLFDPNLLGPGVRGPNFLTRDEEASGIIDLESILGKGWSLSDTQAHYSFLGDIDPATPGTQSGVIFDFTGDGVVDAADRTPAFTALATEFVQGGQLYLVNTNVSTANLSGGVLAVRGTVSDDTIEVRRSGNSLLVKSNGKQVGSFSSSQVATLVVDGGAGSDSIKVDSSVAQKALLRGGVGDDSILAGGARSILTGDKGVDYLKGGTRDDILIGGITTRTEAQLISALGTWAGTSSTNTRINAIRPTLAPSIQDDQSIDRLAGNYGIDWFFKAASDRLLDLDSREVVN